MTIYIILVSEKYSDWVFGAYSTEEKAKAVVSNMPESDLGYTIIERILDQDVTP